MKTIKKSKRIQWLDFAKGFAIIFVVFGHAFGRGLPYINGIPHYIINVILTLSSVFVMPIYFAISGMLYKPIRNLHDFYVLLYKKCSSFIIPYFVFTFIILFIQHINNFIPTVTHNFLSIMCLPSAYLWFLYALFFIFIIVGIMDLLHITLINKVLISLILLILSSGLHFQEVKSETMASLNPKVGSINPLAGIGGYLFIFLLGCIIRKFNIMNYLKNKFISSSLFIMWIIITFSQIFEIKYLHTYKLFGNTDSVNFGNVIPKIVSVFTFLTIFMIWNKTNFIFKYFDKYGKDTLLIYLMHYPIVYVLIGIIKLSSLNSLYYKYTLIFITIDFIISWIGSIFVCYLSKHVFIINFIFYPRKYVNKLLLNTKLWKYLNNK